MKYQPLDEYMRKEFFLMWVMNKRIIPFIAGMGVFFYFTKPILKIFISPEEFMIIDSLSRLPEGMMIGWFGANTIIKFKQDEIEEERSKREWEKWEREFENQRKEYTK